MVSWLTWLFPWRKSAQLALDSNRAFWGRSQENAGGPWFHFAFRLGRDDRVIVLNRIALSVIEEMRGEHPEFVFSYQGKPLKRMYGRAWRKAREKAGLPEVRVHDLKHTYGRRLRGADVPEEDRKDLLGHRSGRSISTHYSMAEITKLIAYANRVRGDE